MLSKTIIAALLATAVVALPANTGMSTLSLSANRLKAITDSLNSARDSLNRRDSNLDAITPDWILSPKPIDRPGQPSAPTKRDPNSLVKFYIPGTEPVEDVAITKRDPNSLVKFYIPEAPAPDGEEEAADLEKRFYIYHRPPPGPESLHEESDASVEKRDSDTLPNYILYPKLIDRPGQPSAPVKRDPNSLDTFWTPAAPAAE